LGCFLALDSLLGVELRAGVIGLGRPHVSDMSHFMKTL